MKKAWSTVALVVLIGMLLYAFPKLPEISLTGWDGLFSVAWLGLAGCVAVAHVRRLKMPKRQKYATMKMRKPKKIVHKQQRLRGQG